MNDNPKRRAGASNWNEADTCRKFVAPKLQAVGWDDEPHSIAEQRTFADGRMLLQGNQTDDRKLQFTLPEVRKDPAIDENGYGIKFIGKFGGADQFRNAVNQLESLLYAT